MRSAPSEQSDYISDRNIKDNIKQSKINEHETPLDEILYNQFSVDENLDKHLEEQNLLGWIELIENPKLYEAVKNLSIDDQIFISYIVKEGRTQRELGQLYRANHSTLCRRFKKIISVVKKNMNN